MRRKAPPKEEKPRARAARPALARGMLPELVGYHLRRAQVAVFADFAASIGRHGLTPGQFGVLELIRANEGLNQSELGQAMGVDRSTVVAVIDRLEGRGLVERAPAPGDRRAHALRLTEAGGALLARLEPLVRGHEARLLAGIPRAERAGLVRLLGRIRRNLSGEGET